MTETKVGSTDQQLVTRVQQGDKRAFDLLVLKYQYRVHAIVGRFIRDSHEVEDVTQEAFLKAYRALPRFRGDSQFYTWLFRIAVNTAKNYLVARSRRPPSSDVNLVDAEFYAGSEQLKDLGTPENQLFRDELETVINKAIEELPEDLRTAVTLREYEGLSYEDISGVMDCPVGTVRSRIFRARETIDIRVLELMEGS
tara:strand:- start:3845 stop:4435 length:591 start_codon:yes stop_codon:yes gene_type:complete